LPNFVSVVWYFLDYWIISWLTVFLALYFS